MFGASISPQSSLPTNITGESVFFSAGVSIPISLQRLSYEGRHTTLFQERNRVSNKLPLNNGWNNGIWISELLGNPHNGAKVLVGSSNNTVPKKNSQIFHNVLSLSELVTSLSCSGAHIEHFDTLIN